MIDLAIIGSGPAGLTAAIYAARANLAPILFEGDQPGGQLTTTTEVENFPGFPKGVLGPEMMQIFKEQAEKFGTKVVNSTVTKVNFAPHYSSPQGGEGRGEGGCRVFQIFCGDELFEARAIIISTGASAKKLGLENEKKLWGRGVSACATCDGFFFKDKIVAVVGGGDTAMEEANFLTRFAKKVYLVHRRGEFRASKIMQERVINNPKIEIIFNTEVKDILGVDVGHVTGISIRNLENSQESKIECDGVFVAIGHEPNTKIFVGQIDLDQKGYIVTQVGSTKTSIDGIFAAGDCADHIYRQAVVAAGTGCMAALDAQKYLET